jgi:anaerobic selenocysteine-containing dehydrogenase
MAECCRCGEDITALVKRACEQVVSGPTMAAQATTVQVQCPYCGADCEYECPRRLL